MSAEERTPALNSNLMKTTDSFSYHSLSCLELGSGSMIPPGVLLAELHLVLPLIAHLLVLVLATCAPLAMLCLS